MVDQMNELETQSDIEQLDPEAVEISDRREFLRSLGKWSTAAIAAIVLIESSPSNETSGGVNRPGSWANRRDARLNRPTNRIAPPASSAVDGALIDRGGGGWLNSRGGGGGWVNRRRW